MKHISLDQWNAFHNGQTILRSQYVIKGFKRQKINVHRSKNCILTYGLAYGEMVGIRDNMGRVRYHFDTREELDQLLEYAKEHNDVNGDQFLIG